VKTALGGPNDSPEKILICDDERGIVRFIQVNLERQGYSVACAYNGKQALELLEGVDGLTMPVFDKVLIDLMLPIVDGIDLLKWIRFHDHTKGTWVGLMVHHLRDCDRSDLAPLHPDKYLVKPIDPNSIFS